MSKTFEAIQKARQLSALQNGVASVLNHWEYLNIKNKKAINNILNKVVIEGDSENFQIFHFASVRDGEGTSTILANLAWLMAEVHTKFNDVIFIDGNLVNPVFHTAFNLPFSPGLSEVLSKKASLSETIHRLNSSSIYLMTCGDTAIADNIGMKTNAIVEFFKELKSRFQAVILDSPPLLDSPIALLWANSADISYLVVQAEKTNWEVANKAKEILENNSCTVGGVVLNRVKHRIPDWLYKRL